MRIGGTDGPRRIPVEAGDIAIDIEVVAEQLRALEVRVIEAARQAADSRSAAHSLTDALDALRRLEQSVTGYPGGVVMPAAFGPMTEPTRGRLYVTAVAMVGRFPTRRLRRVERWLRVAALRDELGRPGLAASAAIRMLPR